MPCAQIEQLQKDFPATLGAVEKRFLPAIRDAVTDTKGKNPAGYLLYQLSRARDHAVSEHGAEIATTARCDSNFAREVCWLSDRKIEIRNLIPFLGSCWYNLVHEREDRWSYDRSPPAMQSGATDPLALPPGLIIRDAAAEFVAAKNRMEEKINDAKIARARASASVATRFAGAVSRDR